MGKSCVVYILSGHKYLWMLWHPSTISCGRFPRWHPNCALIVQQSARISDTLTLLRHRCQEFAWTLHTELHIQTVLSGTSCNHENEWRDGAIILCWTDYFLAPSPRPLAKKDPCYEQHTRLKLQLPLEECIQSMFPLFFLFFIILLFLWIFVERVHAASLLSRVWTWTDGEGAVGQRRWHEHPDACELCKIYRFQNHQNQNDAHCKILAVCRSAPHKL